MKVGVSGLSADCWDLIRRVKEVCSSLGFSALDNQLQDREQGKGELPL